MSESESERGAAPSSPPDIARSAVLAGAMLREAREAAGLHVAALAVSLKVPVKKLEALEAGQLDQLPDAVFARALAASVCRGLKLDPKAVLDLLPQGARSRLGAESPRAINQPYQAASARAGLPWLSRPSPGVLAVVALLLAALAIYFFPVRHDEPAAEVAGEAVSAPAAAPVPADAPAQGAASVPVAAASQAMASTSVPADLPAAAAAPVGQAAPVAPAAPDDAPRVVVFVARAESWVQVTDARGKVVLQRTMQANETADATGALPLAVVVGRIDAVDVQVRGKTLDLAPIAKTNVARFEVK